MTNDAIKKVIEQNLPEYEESPINEDDLYNKVHEQFQTLDRNSFANILIGMVGIGKVRTVPFQRGGVPGYTKPGISRLPQNHPPIRKIQ